jgi:hypothetical protein
MPQIAWRWSVRSCRDGCAVAFGTHTHSVTCSRSSWIVVACAVVVLSAVSVSGCSVTVTHSVASTTHANEASYRQAWGRDWADVIRASAPWNPVGSAPGACDKGADINDCYRTDQAVLPTIRRLLTDLRAASVPPQWVTANQTILTALNAEGQGLTDRDAGIARSDDGLFQQSITDLDAARTDFETGYAQFPNGDRPSPALFGPGRRAG